MDDRHLARLVDEVERSFPGDLAAQREAWEFLESFMEAWDDDEASAPTTAGADAPTAARRLLVACRELLSDTAGRVVSAIEELVPSEPALLMGDVQEAPTVEIHAGTAAELGVAPEITVEVGLGFVTLIATIGERSTPERLAAILQTPAGPDTPDGEVIVRRFARLDATLATCHFDLTETAGIIGLALVVFPGRG